MGLFGLLYGGSASSGSSGLVVVTNNVTTAEAIRDRVIALILALTPTVLAGDRFQAFRFEGRGAGAYEAWCMANPAAAFRQLAVRGTGTDRRPAVRNAYVEEHFLTLEIAVAYPQTSRTGPDAALDRDDAASEDGRLIEQAVCVNGYGNFVGAVYPNATPLDDGDPVSRRELDGVDLLVITQTYRYYRRGIAG